MRKRKRQTATLAACNICYEVAPENPSAILDAASFRGKLIHFASNRNYQHLHQTADKHADGRLQTHKYDLVLFIPNQRPSRQEESPSTKLSLAAHDIPN
ncbi:MAG: hypothetical protein GQ528_09295 [Woeseiaceae bacterium]|nr:hypothetical protein [Woeseiaceae bacterium]